MKNFAITKSLVSENNGFDLKIQDGDSIQVLFVSQDELSNLATECEKYTKKISVEHQEIFRVAHKQGEEIYKKHLQVFFNK